MNSQRILEIQAQRGAKATGRETQHKTIDFVISDCRRFIQDRSESYRDLETEAKRNVIKELIVSYVMSNPMLVDGYTDEENKPDTNKLVDRLIQDITDYGVLTSALIDESIYEIRCNGKEIKVEQDGRIRDLRDRNGNVVSFESPEQQEIIMRKLLGDIRLTPKDALVNARTIEGYRIAAVHSSAMAADPNDPTAPVYHSFVLRKFKKSKLTLGNIVRYGTMSDGMARMCALAPSGGLTWVTCGPTASGKTTTNNAILQEVSAGTRVVLIQNPSEIDLRFKDASGRTYNDVLHLEAVEKENPTASDPTAVNLMEHTLRLSPTLVCFGELRKNKEFMLGMTILEAGHPVNSTFHAEDAAGAVQRFLTAYMAESGEGVETALPTLTSLLNYVVVQKIMKDGTRKVLQITEVIGVDPENPHKPLLNDIYVFEPTGEAVLNEAGEVVEIPGIHKRVGKISDKTIRKLRLEGVPKKKFEYLTKDIQPDEVETYTGEDIGEAEKRREIEEQR